MCAAHSHFVRNKYNLCAIMVLNVSRKPFSLIIFFVHRKCKYLHKKAALRKSVYLLRKSVYLLRKSVYLLRKSWR
jgi:hypothetical protein